MSTDSQDQSNETEPNKEWAQSVADEVSGFESDPKPQEQPVDEIDAELIEMLDSESVSDESAEQPESASSEVSEVAAIAAERDSYLEASRRLQAEFENYRKQVSKRESDARSRANESLVSEILPVLDACDAALENGSEEVTPISVALTSALEKQGLEKIDPAGETFDPEQHEAVMHSEGDSESGPVVDEVLRAGYRWKGRVIRPAMVQVKG